jgi:hypothetical protein
VAGIKKEVVAVEKMRQSTIHRGKRKRAMLEFKLDAAGVFWWIAAATAQAGFVPNNSDRMEKAGWEMPGCSRR